MQPLAWKNRRRFRRKSINSSLQNVRFRYRIFLPAAFRIEEVRLTGDVPGLLRAVPLMAGRDLAVIADLQKTSRLLINAISPGPFDFSATSGFLRILSIKVNYAKTRRL